MVFATGEPVNAMLFVRVPLHRTWSGMGFTATEGFTKTLKTVGKPEQLFEIGVTVNLPEIGTGLALVDVKAKLLPEPLAGAPIAALSLVQVNVVLATVVPIKGVLTFTPVHTTRSLMVPIVGVGLTVILKVRTVPLHPFVKGVTENTEVMGMPKLLVEVKAGTLPVPEMAARPIFTLV